MIETRPQTRRTLAVDELSAGLERAELQQRVRAAIREPPERQRRVIFREP